MARGKGVEIRLQVLITTAVILSMLLLSTLLVSKSYLDRRSALLQSTTESVAQMAASLDSQVGRLVAPLESVLRVLALDPVTAPGNLKAHLERVPALAEVLRATPTTSAVYTLYEDGTVLLLRALRGEADRQRYGAPADASFMLHNLSAPARSGTRHSQIQFYDRELRLLSSVDNAGEGFNPQQQSWYALASRSSATLVTDPYLLPASGVLGVTLARRNTANGTVVAIDAQLSDLSRQLDQLQYSRGSRLVVIDHADQVVAANGQLPRLTLGQEDQSRLRSLAELGEPALEQLVERYLPAGRLQPFTLEQGDWYGIWMPLLSFPDAALRVLVAMPADELLAQVKSQSLWQIYWTLAVMLLLILLGALAGRLISRPLKQLTEEIRSLANFDFTRPVQISSPIREVNALGQVMASMSRTIHHFQRMSLALSREQDVDRMLNDVVRHLKDSLSASAAVLYLIDEEQQGLRRVVVHNLSQAPSALLNQNRDAEVMKQRVAEVFNAGPHGDVLLTALKGRGDQLLGVLGLDLPHNDSINLPLVQRFADELSGAVSTAIETRQLTQRQRRLLDAMIRLLADAIDAKSPYTSGHCERVPELAQMLIDAAEASKDEPFREFAMNELQRDEFKVAAWLHDCGKITSPEYVIDKATKLETNYNRIHEIRTRFEVLWRDAEISYLKAVVNGGAELGLRRERNHIQQQLQQDFAFLASANIGAEFLAEANVERLRQIGSRTWQRHFDRRLGLSRDEYDRLPLDVHMEQLPVTERLLDDRPDHLIHWGERKPPVQKGDPNNRWGFDMKLPDYAFNLGEIYNLAVQRGTLTDEERFHINDHIVQTICMLSSLPLPPELRQVPDIAGNHHERLDGQGYPRKLGAKQLSIPERVMAVADIFEALTASDRPYKKAKTLSESLLIMAKMAQDQHIDADLFELFLDARIYLTYAERYLQPEQIDESAIDRRQLLLLARRRPVQTPTAPTAEQPKGANA